MQEAAPQAAAAALFLPTSSAFAAAHLGVLCAGKFAVPVNMMFPPEQIGFILRDSGAGLVLTTEAFAGALAPLGVPVLTVEEAACRAPRRLPEPAGGAAHELATILYTSGTTTRPKGVELTHHNLVANVQGALEALDFAAGMRLVGLLPAFHIFGLTDVILVGLAAGAAILSVPKFDPQAVLHLAEKYGADAWVAVPSMLPPLAQAQARSGAKLPTPRLVVTGGEPLPGPARVAFQQAFGGEVLEGYGLTEASPVVAVNRPGRNRPGTVGEVFPDTALRLVQPETLETLGPDTDGEIWVRGPGVMRGYHHLPQQTEQTLTPDGWLKTGDIGRLSRDGYLTITGRLKEMMIVAGENVWPAEIEEVLRAHPAVAEAAVVGRPSARRGEEPCGFVTLREGAAATPEQILAACRDRLASFKVPRQLTIVDQLPKTPTGKVLRRLLREP